MDSGRLALLEKAREFGSLAHNMTLQDFLDESVTYRTLALYLGIQSEWWEEFWRSFSFATSNADRKANGVKRIHFCCHAKDACFVLKFLCMWFGKETRLADIPSDEFDYAYHIVMGENTECTAQGQSPARDASNHN